MNKIFTISGLILAASVGFFISAVVFKSDNRPPYEQGMERFQCDRDSFPSRNGMGSNKYSQNNRGPMMQGPSKYKMDSLLELSKDQTAAMEQHMKSSNSLRKALTQKIRDAEFRLHDALNAETISEADLKSIRTELLALNEQRLDNKITDVRFFVSTLTPEQNKKLRELDSKMMKQMQNAPRGMNKFDGDEDPGEMEPGGPRRDGQGPHMDGNGPHQDGQGPRMGDNGPRPMTLPPQER
jgi:Spy/CpxP family protein refolding chaperone